MYTVYSKNGLAKDATEVQTTQVNLTAWHGQYKAASGGQPESKPVGELNEGLGFVGNFLIPMVKASGAFTVGNFNDSDVDGLIDSADNDPDGQHNTVSPGSGEVDLIRIVMQKPAQIPQEKVMLKITQPEGIPAPRVWKEQRKGGNQNLVQLTNNMASYEVAFEVDGTFPPALWVELRGVSATLRDFKIEMSYNKATDSVGATAIWTKHNQEAAHRWTDGYFMASGNGENALPPEADASGFRTAFIQSGSKLGKTDVYTVIPAAGNNPAMYSILNVQVSKFQMQPSGLTPYVVAKVLWIDTTRSESTRWFGNSVEMTPSSYLPWPDIGNDDKRDDTEDNDMRYQNGRASTDFVFSIDAPGLKPWYSYTKMGPDDPKPSGVYSQLGDIPIGDYTHRMNMLDFVRIRFDGPFVESNPPAHRGVLGSRSSVFYQWHSLTRLEAAKPAGQSWTLERQDGAQVVENRIAVAHLKDLTQPGGGGV